MNIPISWLLFAAMILFLSVKIAREDERIIVLRLGRFLKVAGPGLVWLILGIDKAVKINLNKDFPGWQGMSPMELEEKIKASLIDRSEDSNRPQSPFH